jgi:hypothetical protein
MSEGQAADSVVVLAEVPVLYVRAERGPEGAAAAFAALERALGGPRGRRFYGWLKDGEYRACVVKKASDDAEALGLGTAAALRAAQAHVRSCRRWEHPRYWAAWVLWGLGD